MTIIRLKRSSAANWVLVNPVLLPGEGGLEIDTGQVKYGDGIRHWVELPYAGEGGAALTGHINSLLPHPVYDDGPSLLLLYENAKV